MGLVAKGHSRYVCIREACGFGTPGKMLISGSLAILLGISALSLLAAEESGRKSERYCGPCFDPAGDCLGFSQYVLPSNPTNDQCNLALERIVYQPPAAINAFLDKVGRAAQTPHYPWFTQGVDYAAKKLHGDFSVAVSVTNALGQIIYSISSDGNSFGFSPSGFYSYDKYMDTQRAFALNLPATNREAVDNSYYRTAIIWGPDGQMYSVTLFVSLSTLPLLG